jgi:hypothetical protein
MASSTCCISPDDAPLWIGDHLPGACLGRVLQLAVVGAEEEAAQPLMRSVSSIFWTVRTLRARSTIAVMRPRKLGRTGEGIGYYLESVKFEPCPTTASARVPGEAYVSRATMGARQSNCRSRSSTVRTVSITRNLAEALTEAHAF